VSTKIPPEICTRFETATKLSDEDRQVIIEMARQALKSQADQSPDGQAETSAPRDAKP